MVSTPTMDVSPCDKMSQWQNLGVVSLNQDKLIFCCNRLYSILRIIRAVCP